jgi:two-component system, sensor histidine kinase
VLLDVNLPDINGIEVCRRIKSDAATAAVLVLQVSATFVTASDRTRALEGGADAYLIEPVEPQELVANVRALVRLREAEQALRQSEERFRLIANATSDALWDWDLVTHEVWSSERLRPFFGYAPEHVRMDPKWWYAHVHPEDRPRVLAGIRAALQDGRSTWSKASTSLLCSIPKPSRSPVIPIACSRSSGTCSPNAIKFTAKGGHVTVTLERVDPFIQITVADTGKGINPEALPYVFDHFWQADSSTKRIHGGLGLGLAIVHHITELHGGQVTVDSPGLGQGATFTVRLSVLPN